MQRLRQRAPAARIQSLSLFRKLIRTKNPTTSEDEPGVTGRSRFSRCLSTVDLFSLGAGSCVGTGMYLVTGLVAHQIAGPGVVISYVIAAFASALSGASYAEFGARVPHTTGSAYTYAYVAVGEFVAFVIGWNMVLEYVIGTSACARAISACFDTISGGAIDLWSREKMGTLFGEPPDIIAFFITLGMTGVLLTGARKSLLFNHALNITTAATWTFAMAAGSFYLDTSNWTKHKGFLPFGWRGVFSGAATCFYAFIGFDVIATTGEEAHNPKRSIPVAIMFSLLVVLFAYVSSALVLTLTVPYEEVSSKSALVAMFRYVGAPTCQYSVAVGAVAGLTASMFGSMFPMPRVLYAMSRDGLIPRKLSVIWETAGVPAYATIVGGLVASFFSLFVSLRVLVEMMSIGTLLAYTLVSACVLILRYQPNLSNLIELLPQRLRIGDEEAPAGGDGFEDSGIGGNRGMNPNHQRVMIRRFTRTSPDSDESLPGDDSEEFGRDDQFLVSDNTENKYYGTVHTGAGGNASSTRFGGACAALGRRLCPGLFPWVEPGPPTEASGMFVTKTVGKLFILMALFDALAAYGSPGDGCVTNVLMSLLALTMFVMMLAISRKPQNRNPNVFMCPGLPFVPVLSITINVYLALNLSHLTLVRFVVWMAFGMIVYFRYGIFNSTLAQPTSASPPTPASPSPTRGGAVRRIAPARPPPPTLRPAQSRNIFQGDLADAYADGFKDPFSAWEESDHAFKNTPFMGLEQRYDEKTDKTSSHTTSAASAPAVSAAARLASCAAPGVPPAPAGVRIPLTPAAARGSPTPPAARASPKSSAARGSPTPPAARVGGSPASGRGSPSAVATAHVAAALAPSRPPWATNPGWARK